MSVLYRDGMSLTGLNIDSIVAESKEDRANLRMLLMGALKVDERGCHALGHNIGSNASTQNPDATNGDMPLGNGGSMDAVLKVDYSLEEKLRIIDTLTAAIQHNEPMMYSHTKEAETKLLALVQSI